MQNLSRNPESVAAAKLVLGIGGAIAFAPDLTLADAVNALIKEAAPALPKERRHLLLQLIVDADGDAFSLMELGFALAMALEKEAA
ncbi:MAG: hypothetical protein ACR65X_10755 [Methylocystis sp.]